MALPLPSAPPDPPPPPPGGPAPRPSRRTLIARGLFGGALLAAGGAGFLFSRGTRRVALPSRPLAVLTGEEYAVLHAIAGRVIAPAPDGPTLEETDAVWQVDQILAQVDAGARKEIQQLLGLFESALGGFVFGLRTRPFTQLSPAEQDQVLQEWQTSRLAVRRTGYQALRTLVLAAYYGHRKAWEYVRYPGPPAAFHDPGAPVWTGGGQPRPEGPGVLHEEEGAP